MQADSKAVDAALHSMKNRVGDIKSSVSSLMVKLESQKHPWPSVCDSFTSMSGHVETLLKQLRSDKTPPLHNLVLFPLEISNEHDKQLTQITEHRVPVFHHEIVPDYLRTKLDLQLEEQQQQVHKEAQETSKSPEETEQAVMQLNDIVTNVVDMLTVAREELGEYPKQKHLWRTDNTDTLTMLSAINHGTGAASGAGGKAPSSMKAELNAATVGSQPYTVPRT